MRLLPKPSPTQPGGRFRWLTPAALLVAVGTALSAPAQADEADAKSLLQAMSDYMAAQAAISFDYDTTLEIITSDLQKLGLASSGSITVNRPDMLVATRSGGFANVAFFFDGKTATLFGKDANAYGQVEIPGNLDDLIGTLRDKYGRPIPGADLLESDIYAVLMADVTDLKDLGSGVIGGVECDHLAARTAEVDWQIWIAQGDAPYPCRYTITSRLLAGSPQYTVDLGDWKAGAGVAAADFDFKNTTQASLADLDAIADLDELPGIFAIGATK